MYNIRIAYIMLYAWFDAITSERLTHNRNKNDIDNGNETKIGQWSETISPRCFHRWSIIYIINNLVKDWLLAKVNKNRCHNRRWNMELWKWMVGYKYKRSLAKVSFPFDILINRQCFLPPYQNTVTDNT